MPESAVLDVKLTGSYPLEDIDRLITDVLPLLVLRETAAVRVDLRDLSFLLPSTIAVLSGVLARVKRSGLASDRSTVLLPQSGDVRNYLLRMDLIQTAFGRELEESFQRKEAKGFRACEEFVDEESSNRVARELTEALRESCSMDDDARAAIHTCLGELCNNVTHHASSDLGGFAVAQGFSRANRVEVAIADLGIGIRSSLAQNPEYAGIEDDGNAIEAAMRLGVTSKPQGSGHPRAHSGYGLAVTRALLEDNGGRLVVKSGDGEVWAGAKDKTYICDVDYQGTLVMLEAQTDRPLTIKPVYDRLLGEPD